MRRLNRVAIVGMGLINSQGIGSNEIYDKKNAYPDLESYEGTLKIGYSQIGDIDAKKYLPGISLRCTDRITTYAGIATSMAISNYISDTSVNTDHVGMALGSAMGSIVSISNFDLQALTEGAGSVNPMEFPNTVSNAPTSKVGIWFKLKGPSVTISNGFTSSLDSIGFAFDEIAYGKAQYYIAGGCEEVSDEVYKGYTGVVLGKEENNPGTVIQKELIGEGAGAVFLCPMENAVYKGYKIYAEISDFFSSKIVADKHYGETVKSIVNSMLDANELSDKEIKVYTSKLINNKYASIIYGELTKLFGENRVIVNNTNDNISMNYLGLNGVFNMAYAIQDIRTDNSIKAALICDVGCDGRLSCAIIKY
ncbi:MAG: hypothetical protein N3B21_00485 [Clostridia bacterium]|nr:hypothetical protein [Clostridia bacterium]